jgi:hypothetical protein
MTRKITIAAAQYPLDELKSFAEYEAKITRWVEEAVGQGAELLVFPEYGAMELAAITGSAGDVASSFDAVSALTPELDRVHLKLAARNMTDNCCRLGLAAKAWLHDERGAYLRAHGDPGALRQDHADAVGARPVAHCFGQDADCV